MVISFLQSKRKSDPKKGKSQSPGGDVVWPSSVCAFFCLLPLFKVLCTYAFYDVLPLDFLFLLQVEVPPSTTGGTLVKEVITTHSAVPPGMEEALVVL